MTRFLLIDFHDSYTYNVRELVHAATGVLADVVAFDDSILTDVFLRDYDGIVLSPGPGTPLNPRDVGTIPKLIERYRGPVLGICMGHQLLASMLGATVARVEPRHGAVVRIQHRDSGLFAGLPQDFQVVRYHSLAVTSIPDRMVANAWSDHVLMGFHAVHRPWWGVQFHPESVLSECGAELVRAWAQKVKPPARADSIAELGEASTCSGDKASFTDPNDEAVVMEIPPPNVVRAHDVVAADRPWSFWLDSSLVVDGLSRWSIIGTTVSPSLRAWADRVEVMDPNGQVLSVEAPGAIASLRRQAPAGWRLPVEAPELPLHSGWVGYLGYEARREFGLRVCQKEATTPEAAWMRADRCVIVDHRENRAYLVAAPLPDRASAQAWVESTAHALQAECDPDGTLVPESLVRAAHELPHYRRDDNASYQQKVSRAQEYLYSGDSYEVCLTTTARTKFPASPSQLRAIYLRQRAANPAPYAAFLCVPGATILSSSPERFLSVHDGVVETKPIKGTLPRGRTAVEDEQLRQRLAADPKSRAELLMVVDLLRNDLARVCQPGSVITPDLMVVESYQTVHQLLSRIRGRLRSDTDVFDVLAATFPGGSMTGAPKERTLEIIDGLEADPRGIYSGTLGWLGDDGAADLSIVIRTAVHDGTFLSVGAGGAIVLDSDPFAECEEMLLKMAAPLRWTHK